MLLGERMDDRGKKPRLGLFVVVLVLLLYRRLLRLGLYCVLVLCRSCV